MNYIPENHDWKNKSFKAGPHYSPVYKSPEWLFATMSLICEEKYFANILLTNERNALFSGLMTRPVHAKSI